MSTKVYKTTFKLRRGTLSEWASKNPILQLGEPGFVTDLNKLKIGNGEDAWNDLPYLTGSGGGGISVLEHSLIIGEHVFDGSQDVYIPIYDGDMSEEKIRELLQCLSEGSDMISTMTVVEVEERPTNMAQAHQFAVTTEPEVMQFGVS